MKHFLPALFLCLLSAATLHAQGLNFNDAAYHQVPRKKSNAVVTAGGLPHKADLSMYVPTVIDQGKLGTCVGVSTGYYMRTILEAKRLDITDRDSIDALRFSPSFLYNSIKDPLDKNCKRGTEVAAALEFLKNKGVVKLTQQPYPDCSQKRSAALQPEAGSRIMDYIRLFGLNDRQEDVIISTKKALAEGTPVVIAIQTTPSLDDLGFWHTLWIRFLRFFGMDTGDEFGLWDPAKSKKLRGGHAVCVVGYDDARFGGAFHVVNSRGEQWGDDGFFWIRYADYSKHAKYAFQAYLPAENHTEAALRSGEIIIELANLRSTQPRFSAQLSENAPLAAQSDSSMATYALLDPQPTDTEFKFKINVDKQTYLYVLGANSTQRVIDKLFPLDSISPMIGADTKVILPSEEQVYALNATTGTENWLFLFADREVNIDSCITEINARQGPFTQRVQDVMGTRLIRKAQVRYQTRKIGFELREKHEGLIVPLLVTLKHVKKRRM